MMFREILLGALGLMFGAATSAGSFALLVTLQIVPRMAARTQTAGKVMTYETTITLGGITGCLLSLFPFLRIPGLGWLTPFLGIAVGVFVGCQAVALAEILNVFPIMFRRMKLKKVLSLALTAMALGKVAGSLFYFFCGYQVD